MSTAAKLRAYLGIVFLFLVIIAYITERIREKNLRKLEKKVISLAEKFRKINSKIVSRELKIREYDAKILLRKLASRGKIKRISGKSRKESEIEKSEEYSIP